MILPKKKMSDWGLMDKISGEPWACGKASYACVWRCLASFFGL